MKNKKKKLEELIPDDSLRNRVVDQLYSGKPLLGEGSVFSEMLQSILNASLEGEIDHYLSEQKAHGVGNRRNGHIKKTLRTQSGPVQINTPRDRNGTHDPILVGKRARSFDQGIENAVMSLYARGNSVEDIRRLVGEMYGLQLSAGMISTITDRVQDEITQWQQRPLEGSYAIVYLDGIHYRAKEDGKVIGRTIYTVYGISVDGQRDVLGLYTGQSEGARYWGLILEDLKRRGVEDIFFVCIDGLTGFKEVIEQVYPLSIVQRCVVHMIRSSTRYVSYKDIKKVCSDLRTIYTAANEEIARQALEQFGNKWDKKYPEIKKKWEDNWHELMAFMDYGEHIRRMIYTTNPVESLHRIMRKVTKSKGAWISERALIKQLYLALTYNEKSWKRRAFHWSQIEQTLSHKFGERYSRWLAV